MKKFIISVGGSIVNPGTPDIQFLNSFSRLILDSNSSEFGIVVGGGKPARVYVEAMRKLGSENFTMDNAGILATRMNALLMLSALKSEQKLIPETVEIAHHLLKTQKSVVMGGTVPGHTTDTVSMLLAEISGIDTVINITSVDGVYTKDPAKYRDAEKIEKLPYTQAFELSLASYGGAASNQFMDSVSLLIGMRSGIKIKIMSGLDMENIKSALEGKKFNGTVIGD